MSDALVVLARSPRAGAGKSRLRASLRGCAPAAVDRLVRALTEDTLGWAGSGRRLVVAGCGDPRALRLLARGAEHVAQPVAPFGARIEAAVGAGFAALQARGRVVQIGTDSPSLPADLLDAAYDVLRGPDAAALVPAADGGWVALGLGRPLEGEVARADIRWSTGHAAADTAAALRSAGRRVAVLPSWYDVDGEDGLRRLEVDATAALRAPRTLRALRAVRQTIAELPVPA
jgi:uncharacterized protein